MDDGIELHWWQKSLRALAILFGLLALAAISMVLIILAARFLDTGGGNTPSPAPIYINLAPPPPPENNARTREPGSDGRYPWPSHPGRGAGTAFGGGDAGRAAPVTKSAPAIPTGISVAEFRAASDEGRTLYLPDPKGKCDVSGQSAAKTIEALESCFAQRVAR